MTETTALKSQNLASIDDVIMQIKELGKTLNSDLIIVFKNHRIEYHHSHRMLLVETRETEKVEFDD